MACLLIGDKLTNNLILLIFLSGALVFLSTIDFSYAAEPPNICVGSCRADVTKIDSQIVGGKYTMTVPDLSVRPGGTFGPTGNDCNRDIIVVTQWINLADGRWFEIGVTAGPVDFDDDNTADECLIDEAIYYAYCDDPNLTILPGAPDYPGACHDGGYHEFIAQRNTPINSQINFETRRHFAFDSQTTDESNSILNETPIQLERGPGPRTLALHGQPVDLTTAQNISTTFAENPLCS